MDRSAHAKDRIIAAATALIEAHGGQTAQITARMIAQRAGVGLGLINYHFGGKDQLITVCVQRIIGQVVADFRPAAPGGTDEARLAACAAEVFEFLFAHPAIARISILGDLQHYTADCNSVRTQRGFAGFLPGDIPDRDQALLAFVLTAAMQAAFLGREAAGPLLGCDLTGPEGRAACIRRLVHMLFEGAVRANES